MYSNETDKKDNPLQAITHLHMWGLVFLECVERGTVTDCRKHYWRQKSVLSCQENKKGGFLWNSRLWMHVSKKRMQLFNIGWQSVHVSYQIAPSPA